MEKIQVEILHLAKNIAYENDNSYSLVLKEKQGNRRFPVIIGRPEAQAIALAIDGLQASRPLTHDLLHQSFQSFNIDIIEVLITKLSQGIFYAQIVCEKNERIIELDSRTSDAIALALRFRSPIYVSKKIINEIGIEVKSSTETIEEFAKDLEETVLPFSDSDSLEHFCDEELEDMMQEALEDEDYEAAAKIRDEIKKRKKNQ